MAKKSLIITIILHKGYFKTPDSDKDKVVEKELLFSAITDTYIPLLNLFEKLDEDSVPFKLAMVISPTLCSQLADYDLQARYVKWLESQIALGEREVSNCKLSDLRKQQAEKSLKYFKKTYDDYVNVYKFDLISAFKYYADRGTIEFLATAGTFAFLPHYTQYTEALNAQIEAGLYSHKQFFGLVPDGFWLPAMGYVEGLDKIIKDYGFSYTVLDTHGLLFANPLPNKGIFSPVRCPSGLFAFARDFSIEEKITGEKGFINTDVYRNQNRDLAFEADISELPEVLTSDGKRISSGYKYWKNTSVDGNDWYDENAAEKAVKTQAEDFVAECQKKLNAACDFLETSDLSLTCTLDGQLFGQRWHEGVDWLEQVIRLIANNQDMELSVFSAYTKDKNSLQEIKPFMSSCEGTGYGENFLDTSNSWMLRYSHKACERMVYLVERFPDDTGLKARVLNMAAKEVLLSQSFDWAKMLQEKNYPEYAETQFKKNILSFTTVYDSLGANTISTEWLTKLEQEHSLFSWMNYHIFSEKK